MKNIVFFGGKGGVGKTSSSASYSLFCAQRGYKTLIVSTDPAHSLGDIFEVEIGNKIRELDNNLFGLEIDPEKASDDYIKRTKAEMRKTLSPIIIEEIERQIDAMVVSPGSEEAAIFDELVKIIINYTSDYDVIIFDTAPTGHTIRLLSLPELMGAWMDSLISSRREAVELMKMSTVGNKELHDKYTNDPVLNILMRRKEEYEKAREILIDSRKACFVFVLNPEKLPIIETQKAISILAKYGIQIGGVIINKVLPDDISDEFLLKRKQTERFYMEEIYRKFKDMILMEIPLFPDDIQGKLYLEKVSLLYTDVI
ncbi:ArsA family ATPase [Calorimonas adulescens]|uniref:AAA family ATPase n=1 Tax=Calorimonas adulescens TaxID=2606906 RepID=A0A5D8QH49_9THEO|nr:TRC40/GET3/ArsA family transport-energizing ATPase [Calorimonas adulescens]TZE82598.1 AAA family ATPase [Calorimonas adulescens]